MNTAWIKLPEKDKITILEQTAARTGYVVQAIEKDWWVTTVLEALFSLPFADHLSFKGGTSLSKCWQLVNRFSEDVDIAINREFLGFGGELSKNKRNDGLRRAACTFVRGKMKQGVEEQLLTMGLTKVMFSVIVNETPVSTTDPETIEVHYKSLFAAASYIQTRVLIEVSGRSMAEPIESINIKTLVATTFPNVPYADTEFAVRAVSPKRTFLEKAFLLHEELHRAEGLMRVERMSRHLYDLEKLMDTAMATEALADMEFYNSVIEHRRLFIGLNGFDYDTLQPATINFVPPANILKDWEDDYIKMQRSMIQGNSLPFADLIARINLLNERFRALAAAVK